MFCPKCGTKLEKDASFCPECGEKIERRPTELFPKKQVHKSRFKRITFSCNNKWDYIWIAVFVVLVVAAGSKMVSSLVKASYNITYADNSSSSYTRNEISSKRKNNTGSSYIKEWGSNVVKDVEKSISSIGGCKAKGCSDPVYKNGYCSYHYAYKTGRDALDHASENIKSGIDSIKENVDSDTLNEIGKGISELFQ